MFVSVVVIKQTTQILSAVCRIAYLKRYAHVIAVESDVSNGNLATS